MIFGYPWVEFTKRYVYTFHFHSFRPDYRDDIIRFSLLRGRDYRLFQSDGLEKIHNTHIVINNTGELVAAYRKLHLFDIDNKDTGLRLMESDYVLKGTEIVPPVCTPIGKLGLSIVSLIENALYLYLWYIRALISLNDQVQCYDMRFPELSLTLRNMGAEILTYPSAFTYQTGAAHWEVILRARAIENQSYVVAAAQTGMHNKKRVSWGHAMVDILSESFFFASGYKKL